MLTQTLFCQPETKLSCIDRLTSGPGASWGNTEKMLIPIIMLDRGRGVSKALKGGVSLVLGDYRRKDLLFFQSKAIDMVSISLSVLY